AWRAWTPPASSSCSSPAGSSPRPRAGTSPKSSTSRPSPVRRSRWCAAAPTISGSRPRGATRTRSPWSPPTTGPTPGPGPASTTWRCACAASCARHATSSTPGSGSRRSPWATGSCSPTPAPTAGRSPTTASWGTSGLSRSSWTGPEPRRSVPNHPGRAGAPAAITLRDHSPRDVQHVPHDNLGATAIPLLRGAVMPNKRHARKTHREAARSASAGDHRSALTGYRHAAAEYRAYLRFRFDDDPARTELADLLGHIAEAESALGRHAGAAAALTERLACLRELDHSRSQLNGAELDLAEAHLRAGHLLSAAAAADGATRSYDRRDAADPASPVFAEMAAALAR